MGVRIDRVYTKTGDQGTTALVGGKRVGKATPRIEAYGTVDELNAIVGLCRSHAQALHGPKDVGPEVDRELAAIQQDLFDLGADLATPVDDVKRQSKAKLQTSRITDLENTMDRWQETLEPLKSFVLPGGGLLSTQLHLARTVCRRAERLVVGLAAEETILGPAIAYLNRLSDYFFVLSRHVTRRLGEAEVLWVIKS